MRVLTLASAVPPLRLIELIGRAKIRTGVHLIILMNSLLEPLITNFLSPPRESVTAASLGPCVIHTDRGIVMRKDVSIEGLSACLLEPANPKQRIKGTIIYCHSYNSNRSEVLELVPFLH